MTRMLRLAILTSVATYLLIVVGAYVRVTGSGMGCPDWPRCYGELVPDLNVAVNRPMVIEVAHRYGASVVSLLVGALLVTALVAYRRNPAVLRPAVAAAALLMLQVILGGVTVLTGNAPWTVTAHLATSMALLAAAIITAVGAHVTAPRRARSSDRAASTVTEGFALLAAATTIAVYLLLLTGAIVRGEGAGLACKGWPLCNGAVFPAGDRLADIHSFHRLFTVATGVLVGVFVWQSVRRPRPPAIRAWAVIAGVLFAAQVMVGAVQVWSNLSQDTRLSHVAAGAAVWAALVVATALALVAARRARLASDAGGGATEETRPPAGVMAISRAYVNLTKPRIIELLLVTTVPAMVLAARGMPNLWLILGTLVGGTLTAGGANAINCYIDRDIDAVMKRTRGRSLPKHRIAPERALAFGIVIGAVGFLELAVLINLLSAVLAVSAILFYVFVYTLWLKRSTTQNIVIGGAAGAIPPLVGWAAVTGRLDLPALVLFAIIVVWTPPHFWALALRYRGDYAAAGVPMLPVRAGDEATRRQIFWYSLALVAVSVLLYVTGGAGVVYLAVALVAGAALLRMAWQLMRVGDAFPVMKLFTYSITYLTVLFGAMIVDQVARALV